MTRPAATSFPGIDLIRLGAALLVLLYHLAFLSLAGDASRASFTAIEPLAASGWVGVPIFFVISGFVIAFSASGKTARRFIHGRAARLYPAAWICATVTLLVLVQTGQAHPEISANYIRSMLLLPIGPWVSGVYWTLAVEMSFYALVAAVLAWRGPQALPRLAIMLGCYSSVYWIVRLLAESATGSSDWLLGPLNYFAGHLLLIRSGCLFALGMLVWHALDTSEPRRWRPILAFALCGFVSIFVRARTLSLEDGATTTSLLIPPLLWLIVILLMAGAVVWNARITALIGRHGRAVRFFGLLTYPLYLIHSELGSVVLDLTIALGPWLSLLLASASVVAAAALLLPFESLIRRVLFRRQAPSAPLRPQQSG